MAFVRVAEARALAPGAALRVFVRGIEVGLFRVGDEFFALENACPHAGHPRISAVMFSSTYRLEERDEIPQVLEK